jgi:hypothetical protein
MRPIKGCTDFETGALKMSLGQNLGQLISDNKSPSEHLKMWL